jgi:NADH-quinone oxidoreductase subunit L
MVPMVVLGVLSLVGGFYGTPWGNWLGDFLTPVTGPVVELPTGSGAFWLSIILSLALALAGIGLAWMRYGARQASFAPSRNPVVVFLANRWYVDALYERAIVRPILWVGRLFRRDVEGVALDGGTRGFGRIVGWSSQGWRALQTGYARNYALAIFVGAALIVLYYVVHP